MTRATRTNFFYGLNKVDDEDTRHANSSSFFSVFFFPDSVAASWRAPWRFAAATQHRHTVPSTAHFRGGLGPLSARCTSKNVLLKLCRCKVEGKSFSRFTSRVLPGLRDGNSREIRDALLPVPLEIPHMGLAVLDLGLKSSHWAIRTADLGCRG